MRVSQILRKSQHSASGYSSHRQSNAGQTGLPKSRNFTVKENLKHAKTAEIGQSTVIDNRYQNFDEEESESLE